MVLKIRFALCFFPLDFSRMYPYRVEQQFDVPVAGVPSPGGGGVRVAAARAVRRAGGGGVRAPRAGPPVGPLPAEGLRTGVHHQLYRLW